MNIFICLIITMLIPSAPLAKVDLVTLPERDSVQLTIYNSADLTLVKDMRTLTMKKGENKLQFSWANTLIDPTSLDLFPLVNIDKIDIIDLTYPPRIKDLGVWNITSQISGKVPIEIRFFTSGISWQAYYLATLSTDEQRMSLDGYVKVSNNSGEDYANAQVRVVLGEIHILDQIAELARRFPPYSEPLLVSSREEKEYGAKAKRDLYKTAMSICEAEAMDLKEIKKEGVSEYFLYTIEGTETIPTGWSKSLPSFKQDDIPIVNLYKYEEDRLGNNVVRYLSFKNDIAHNLGKEPIPNGAINCFKVVDKAEHLAYVGSEVIKYIPLNEDVELNLGTDLQVEVEPKLINYRTLNYSFNNPDGNISGWDEEQTYNVKVSNYRSLPIKVEIRRNFPHQYWELSKDGAFGEYEKVDLDTVKFVIELAPNTTKTFTYILTLHEGDRRD